MCRYMSVRKDVRTCKKYVRARNTRAEMYVGCVARCSTSDYVVYSPTGQTDRQKPDRYITLSARHGQLNNKDTP